MKWVWLGGAIFFLIDAFQRVAEGGWKFWVSCAISIVWIINFQLTCLDEERRERQRND
jgi:hypothetical protein